MVEMERGEGRDEGRKEGKKGLKESRPAPGSDNTQRKEEGRVKKWKRVFNDEERTGDKERPDQKRERGADANH